MGRYNAHLVGESNYQNTVAKLTVGTPIKLTPEPENQYDPRAIKAVTRSGETVGYVERDSWLTRAMLDEGTTVASRVQEIIGGEPGKPSLGVVLEVLTADDARAALARSASVANTSGSQPTMSGLVPAKGLPIWAIVTLAVLGLFVVIAVSSPTPPSADASAPTQNSVVARTEAAAGLDLADAAESASNSWSYSTDEDKVRGGTTYYATTTSSNSVRQDFPYEQNTTMDMTVRKSPAHGTDVILTVSSGQLMCPSYDGCSGTASFDGGSAQSVSFNGPSDNSSETVFVRGAQGFIGKLKRSKRVVIEKTLYQAGNPQFEFNVAGLKWDH